MKLIVVYNFSSYPSLVMHHYGKELFQWVFSSPVLQLIVHLMISHNSRQHMLDLLWRIFVLDILLHNLQCYLAFCVLLMPMIVLMVAFFIQQCHSCIWQGIALILARFCETLLLPKFTVTNGMFCSYICVRQNYECTM